MLVQLTSAPTSPLGAPPHSRSSHGKQQRHTIPSPLPQPSPSQFLCCLYVLQLNQSTAHTHHLDLVEERYLEVSRISSHGVGRRHELLRRTAPDGQCKAGASSCTNAARDARREATASSSAWYLEAGASSSAAHHLMASVGVSSSARHLRPRGAAGCGWLQRARARDVGGGVVAGGGERRDAGGSDELERRDAGAAVGSEGEQTHPHREHKPGFGRTADSAVYRKPPKSSQSGLR